MSKIPKVLTFTDADTGKKSPSRTNPNKQTGTNMTKVNKSTDTQKFHNWVSEIQRLSANGFIQCTLPDNCVKINSKIIDEFASDWVDEYGYYRFDVSIDLETTIGNYSMYASDTSTIDKVYNIGDNGYEHLFVVIALKSGKIKFAKNNNSGFGATFNFNGTMEEFCNMFGVFVKPQPIYIGNVPLPL